MNSQRPMYRHGLASPPLSTKSTMQDSSPNQRAAWMTSQITDSPVPNRAQLSLYEHRPPIQSPLPKASEPFSPSSPLEPRPEDDPLYWEVRRELEMRNARPKEQAQQSQSQPQSPPQPHASPDYQSRAPPPHAQERPYYQPYNGPPPNAFPYGYAPHNPYTQPMYGFAHPSHTGYPQHFAQPVPLPVKRGGHKFGNITATGDCKIHMGNVTDTGEDDPEAEGHEYGNANISGKVLLSQGTMNTKGATDFWYGGPSR